MPVRFSSPAAADALEPAMPHMRAAYVAPLPNARYTLQPVVSRSEIVMKGARLRGLALAPIASTESALPPTRAIAGFESRAPMESVACVVYAVGVLTSTSLPMGAVASLADKCA